MHSFHNQPSRHIECGFGQRSPPLAREPFWTLGPVHVGFYEDSPQPFIDSQGSVRGLLSEILGAIAGLEGWTIGYVSDRRAECFARLAALPIVAVTSCETAEGRQEATAAGCTHHTEKPGNPESFIDQTEPFPVQPAEAGAMSRRDVKAKAETMRILAVDDQEDARYLLSALLTGNGYAVETAANGEEALDKLRSGAIDLVISDILMPVMDGFQLCREVRKDDRLRNVLFVFYTATYTEKDDKVLGLQLGADDFILKPAEPEVLLARIRAVISSANGKGHAAASSELAEEVDLLRLYSARLVTKLEKRADDLAKEVAKRRKAEEEAKASGDRFRQLFSHMSSCVAIYRASSDGEDFIFVDFNKAAERAEALRREDVIGKSLEEVFPGIKKFGLLDVLRRVWRTGNPEHHPLTEYRDQRIQGWRDNYVCKLPSGELAAIYDDVTEQKQADERIRWLSSLPDENPNPVMRVGNDGRLLYVNRAGEALVRSWDCEVGAVVPSHFHELMREALEEGYGTSEVELEGSALLLMFAPVAGEEYVNVYSADVTGMRRVEEALRKREEEYRLLVESASEAIFIVQDGHIKFPNLATMKLLGLTTDEITSRPFVQFIHPEDQAMVAERHKRRLAGEEVETGYEFRFMTADEGVRWAQLNATRVEWQGRLATLNLISDVTDRKRAEEELRTSEAQLTNALRIAQAGHWEYDVQTDTFTFNDNFYRIFGITVEEVGGYKMSSAEYARRFCHPDDMSMVSQEIQTAIEADDPYYGRELQHRILYANGEVGHVAVRFFIVKDSAGRTVKTCGVNQDITERLEAAQRMRNALEDTIQAVADTIETRDPYTAGHQRRVAMLAAAIAQRMGLPDEQIEGIRVAATLHDIGKMATPAEILSRPGRLSELEFKMIQQHPRVAYDILRGIAFPWPVAEIVLQHHERLDGTGYPEGLCADDGILVEARILAVSDVVEAMSAHRPYRPALGIEAALEEIRSKQGTTFDSDVVNACVELFESGRFTLDD